jgi:hypothetical protein
MAWPSIMRRFFQQWRNRPHRSSNQLDRSGLRDLDARTASVVVIDKKWTIVVPLEVVINGLARASPVAVIVNKQKHRGTGCPRPRVQSAPRGNGNDYTYNNVEARFDVGLRSNNSQGKAGELGL